MSKAIEFAIIGLDEAFKTKGVTHEELGDAAKKADEIRIAFDAAVKEHAATETQTALAKRMLRRCLKDRDGITKKGANMAVKLAQKYEALLLALDPEKPAEGGSEPNPEPAIIE